MKYGEKCQIAVETRVFLKSKNLKEEKGNGMVYPSCLVKELQFKLFEVGGTMNIVTNCFNF